MKLLVLYSILILSAAITTSTEIEPGDPEDIGPDAPQISSPPEEEDQQQEEQTDQTEPTESSDTEAVPEEAKEELSIDARIRQVLDHFKQDDPKGIPGVPIPDPMPIPDFKGQFPVAEIRFSDALIHHLSQFRIDYVRTDLKDLKVWVGLTFDNLEVLGRYRMGSWFSTSSGDFNVTLLEVKGEGFAGLIVDPDGSLQVSNITFDVAFKDIAIHFDNLGFFGSLFQGIINSVGTFIFDSIKPIILEQINDKIQTGLNTQMRELEQYLPDSVPPLDLAFAIIRTQIQEFEMDPFQVPEINFTLQSGMVVRLVNGTLHGISTIHRSGDMKFNLEDGNLVVAAQAATQRLRGQFTWVLDFKLYSPKGHFSLDIEHLDVQLGFKQPINIRKKPRLEVLKVSLGNVQARSAGTGTLDYLVEFGFNFVLNGFKGVLVRTLEKPVTAIIQKQLDRLDLEDIVNKQLDNWNSVSKTPVQDA